ncbi:MAG: hypothetical protein ACREOI_36485, partial [bacterium]
MNRRVLLAVLALWCWVFVMGFGNLAQAQNDVMMQAFYWDVPVDATNLNGSWYDSLKVRAAGLKQAGFTAIWTPPPSKGAFSIYDMG